MNQECLANDSLEIMHNPSNIIVDSLNASEKLNGDLDIFPEPPLQTDFAKTKLAIKLLDLKSKSGIIVNNAINSPVNET